MSFPYFFVENWGIYFAQFPVIYVCLVFLVHFLINKLYGEIYKIKISICNCILAVSFSSTFPILFFFSPN